MLNLTYDEEQLILAIRECGIHSMNVLCCLHNSFTNDNLDKEWDDKLEIFEMHMDNIEEQYLNGDKM